MTNLNTIHRSILFNLFNFDINFLWNRSYILKVLIFVASFFVGFLRAINTTTVVVSLFETSFISTSLISNRNSWKLEMWPIRERVPRFLLLTNRLNSFLYLYSSFQKWCLAKSIQWKAKNERSTRVAPITTRNEVSLIEEYEIGTSRQVKIQWFFRLSFFSLLHLQQQKTGNLGLNNEFQWWKGVILLDWQLLSEVVWRMRNCYLQGV